MDRLAQSRGLPVLQSDWQLRGFSPLGDRRGLRRIHQFVLRVGGGKVMLKMKDSFIRNGDKAISTHDMGTLRMETTYCEETGLVCGYRIRGRDISAEQIDFLLNEIVQERNMYEQEKKRKRIKKRKRSKFLTSRNRIVQ